jgi:uncharacterized membrane protein
MATSIETNITAIASIIAACIAATPPALTAVTDVTMKLRSLSQTQKSSPLNILKIIREPVDLRRWKKVRRNFLINIFLMIAGIIFILVNTILYRTGFSYATLGEFGVVGKFLGFKINALVVINFVFFCFYLLAFIKAYRRMGENPNDARHFLFKKAFLLVESDFQTTVSHCQETLRLLGARVVEFDSETAVIEAYTNKELVSAFGGLYLVKINTEDFKPVGTGLEVEFFPYMSNEISNLTKSSNVNRFIRAFTNG